MATTIEEARDILLDDIKNIADAKNPRFDEDDINIGRGENLRDFAEGVFFLEEARILELG